MKVGFDYLEGPVLGHKTRCQILMLALHNAGHEIVNPNFAKPDWLVYDYPTVPTTVPMGYKRLLLGRLPIALNDYAWHPLGEPAKYTMTGPQYIMVQDHGLAYQPTRNILITCGGADPYFVTEKLVAALGELTDVTVVIGPNFGRTVQLPWHWSQEVGLDSAGLARVMSEHKYVICAWGQTAFEALAMGACVYPITTNDDHVLEAQRLGIPYTRHADDFDGFNDLAWWFGRAANNYGVDYQGVARVVAQMETWLER